MASDYSDYESKVFREYAVGSLEEIKKGKLSEHGIVRTFDLEEAKETYSKANGNSVILLPKLLGVYWRFGLFNKNYDGKNEVKNIDLDAGVKYSVAPSLVQVGYDPSIISKNIITDFLGHDTERILIKSYRELEPPGSEFLRFSDIVSRRYNNMVTEDKKIMEITAEEEKELINVSRNLLLTEGLNRRIFDFLMSSEGGALQ